jgi:hypothetical protein
MTITMLLVNTLEAAERAPQIDPRPCLKEPAGGSCHAGAFT